MPMGVEIGAMRRWQYLVVVVLVALAGCNGAGDRTPEPIEANASQAVVDDETLAETGFSETSLEEVRVNRSGTLSVSGDVQMDLGYTVRATGWRAVYSSAGDGPGTVVSLYTVPNAKPERVAATIDPLGDRSLSTIVTDAQGTYGSVEGLDHTRNRSVSLLGSAVVVREFSATASTGGESTTVTVYVARTEHEGDIVRLVAVAPESAESWETVRAILSGVEH